MGHQGNCEQLMTYFGPAEIERCLQFLSSTSYFMPPLFPNAPKIQKPNKVNVRNSSRIGFVPSMRNLGTLEWNWGTCTTWVNYQ
jgi:hypothetical protein